MRVVEHLVEVPLFTKGQIRVWFSAESQSLTSCRTQLVFCLRQEADALLAFVRAGGDWQQPIADMLEAGLRARGCTVNAIQVGCVSDGFFLIYPEWP